MGRNRRFIARFGLDGNSLRRRTDQIATFGAAGLLVVFLVCAPVLSVLAGGWAGRQVGAELRSQRAWHQVSAVLLQAAPVQAAFYDGSGANSWALARWTASPGHTRSGVVTAPAGAAAGSSERIWVDPSGQWAGPAISRWAAGFDVAGAVMLVPVALGITLLALAGLARWMLDRRRLASWETAWASVGPQWTRQFWSGRG